MIAKNKPKSSYRMIIYKILTASQSGTTSNAISFIYSNKEITMSALTALMLIILAIGCFAFDESLKDTGDIKKYTIISISLILFLLLSIIPVSIILLFFTKNDDDLIKVLSNSNFVSALIGSWVVLIGLLIVGRNGNENLFARICGAYIKTDIDKCIRGGTRKGLMIMKQILLYSLWWLSVMLLYSILSIAIYLSSLLDPTWYFSILALVIAAVIAFGVAFVVSVYSNTFLAFVKYVIPRKRFERIIMSDTQSEFFGFNDSNSRELQDIEEYGIRRIMSVHNV